MKASAFIRRTHVLSISYHFILSHTQSIKMLVTTNDQYTYAIHQFDSLPKWRRRPTTDKKIIKIELASHRLNIHYTYKPSLKSNLIWLCILYRFHNNNNWAATTHFCSCSCLPFSFIRELQYERNSYHALIIYLAAGIYFRYMLYDMT